MKKILVIEDDDISRQTIIESLELEGYVVHSAVNGDDGIRMAKEILPNLIICDIRMPGKTGLEVCGALQKENNTATIPFIFLTANAELADIRLGLQMGADDYITKPFDYDELISAISKRLEKHQRIVETTENKFKILLENSLYGTFIMQENKIIFANNKFYKTLQYSKEEVKNVNFYDLIHKDSLEFFKNKVFRCISEIDKKAQFETIFVNKKKNKINVELFFGLTNINGKPTIIGSFKEINNKEKESGILNELDSALKKIIEEKQSIPDYIHSKIKEFNEETDANNRQKESIKLTKREKEVLQLVCKGMTNKEISDKLFISVRTVEGHRSLLLQKTQSKNIAELVTFAIGTDLIKQ